MRSAPTAPIDTVLATLAIEPAPSATELATVAFAPAPIAMLFAREAVLPVPKDILNDPLATAPAVVPTVEPSAIAPVPVDWAPAPTEPELLLPIAMLPA